MTRLIIKTKDHKIFLLILLISFSVYSFTSHGHRATPDEYFPFVQADQIVNNMPAQDNIPPEVRLFIQNHGYWNGTASICKNGILCSETPIGHAISYMPFLIIEKNFHIIPSYGFSTNDFNDSFYVWWRNSETHEETFTYLFYGPVIASLSVAVFYLICRTYEYSQKTSAIVSFVYAFASIEWAYSTTAFSNVESVLLILTAFLFYRRFKKNYSAINLFFMGLSLGFGVTVRYDMGIFVAILVGYVIYDIMRTSNKLKNITSFAIPLAFFAIILELVSIVRFGHGFLAGAVEGSVYGFAYATGVVIGHSTPIQVGIFGLLFSPGAGIFVFSPILFSAFISLFDFYKKNREDCIFILSYFAALLIFFGTWFHWHGFIAWSARYMLTIIPFLIIPLGASIQKRINIPFRLFVIITSIVGSFFSFAWLIQDVTWFVWGQMGGTKGLFGLDPIGKYPLHLDPSVFWTFQNSQLTQSIILEFSGLQADLYLLKILGPILTSIVLSIILIPSLLYLKLLIKEEIIPLDKESNT
ncbi:membrane hypothetical protein [Nitrosotalea sinensis]|uniref:Glycosyltransferase RgtA/B/C/D-like domain-containing protein n=1 Tax=Nitrosotalea sinensis TaxID=1499975 RepID=A0A2H1EET8_9ARCH|nr:glycosyltransferase family 39 protein [Candidatus Nitrosotalea sinensis]SHO42831.1 membrane hypothetical protein [Candidatus Nitrosotalea sinensis]